MRNPLLGLMALLLAAQASLPSRVWAQSTFPAQNLTRAAAYAADMGGSGVLVLQHDSLVFEDYHNGANASTATHIFSGTKAYWALAAAAAREAGLIDSYEEVLAETLTEWQDRRLHPNKNLIRVKHLLALTSGLSQELFGLQRPDAGVDDLYQYTVDSLTLNFTPGSRFQYGPSHYYAFGVFLQRKLAAAGRSQSPLQFLDSLILQPIGLEYDDWQRDAVGNPYLSRGCILTPRNWVKFGQLILHKGRWEETQLIDSALVNDLFVADGINPGHGKFIWLNTPGGYGITPFQRAPQGSTGGFMYHDGVGDMVGALGAGKNRMYILPSLEAVVVRQTSRSDDDFDDHVFLSLLLEGIVTSSLNPAQQDDSVRVYPNPIVSEVTVDGLRPGARVRFIDGVGRLIAEHTSSVTELKLGVTGLPSGLYLLTVQQDEGSTLARFRVMKQ